MQATVNLLKWLCRAWPVVVSMCVAATHYTLYLSFPEHSVLINKTMSSALQLTGGAFVLYSLDKNIGMFQKKGIANLVTGWFKAFPLLQKPIPISISVSALCALTGSATLSIARKSSTVEERLDELERRLDETTKAIRETEERLNEKISVTRIDLSESISTQRLQLDKLSSVLEETTIGGFKPQAFGVILVVYSAILAIFA